MLQGPALGGERGVPAAFSKSMNAAIAAAGYPLVAKDNTTVAVASNFVDIFTAQKLTIILSHTAWF